MCGFSLNYLQKLIFYTLNLTIFLKNWFQELVLTKALIAKKKVLKYL